MPPVESKFKVAAARVQGRRHEAEGEPCQDAIACYTSPNLAIISLSDGAGSAAYAAQGANVAVKAIERFMKKEFCQFIVSPGLNEKQRLLDAILRSLQKASKSKEADVKSFACTIQFAVTDGVKFLVGQIGDGRVGGYNPTLLKWCPLIVASKGEFINETVFVTSENAIDYFNLTVGDFSEISAFVLMSDGAEEALYQRSSQSFAPAISTMATWVREYSRHKVERSLRSNLKNIIRTKTFDDVSIAILTLTG